MFFRKKERSSSCGNTEMDGPENTRIQYSSAWDLSFPPDHPLSALWALWSGADHLDRPLCLPILSDENCPVSEELLSQEQKHLHWLLTMGAVARLQEITAAAPAVDLDERVLVLLSRDEMMAWVCLLPPVGQGNTLTIPQLCKQLLSKGVAHGFNWPLLRSLPESSQRYFQLFPAACGTPPATGENGYIVDHYPRSINGDVDVDELGQADYYTLKLVQEIQENQIICEIVPPTSGTCGMTVTGKHLPANDGKAADIPQGRNTRLSEDGRYLLAAQDGHVVFSGRNFQVKSVLHIHQDDLHSTPNIKYLGDIHVHCDLNRENTICTMGTVQIDGVLEGCTIEAGENIIVSSGVLGQGTAVLRAQKSVYAKYLENCSVYARESVQADCIINSNIYSNGTVKVRTGRGAIIGGTIRSARDVCAVTVGSKAERPTSIILGGDPCEEAERAQIQEELRNIEQALSQLESASMQLSAKQAASKLRLRQCVARMNLEKLNKELETLQAAAMSCDVRKLSCDIGYPGTQVTIDHSTYTISQAEQPCTIGLSCGRVRLL